MEEQLAILLGLCVLGYVFLSPIILIVLYSKQRKNIRWLEDELQIQKESLQEQRERLARMQQEADSAAISSVPELEPAAKPAEIRQPEPQPAMAFQKPETPAKTEPEPIVQAAVESTSPLTSEPAEKTVSWSEKLRSFLQGIGMWPPPRESGMDRETVLMQWWLPRIGGLLALLSALFFAVYINQDTSPLFKCIELLAVSLGLSAFGLFMERKYKAFGGVLFVTGLIMLYLTSVAAYVVTATRVIESALVGSIVQGVVLVIICILGFLRRSCGIVLLAFYFGTFLSVFMVYENLREGALLEAGLLFVAGLALARKEFFRNLSWVVVPGSFLTVLAFPILAEFQTVSYPESTSVVIFISVVFAGVVAAYFAGLLWEGKIARILLSIGSSLAIASTFLYFQVIDPGNREWGSLILGLVMLAGFLVAWTRRGCGYAAQLLFVKATFLIGVWAILHFAGDLRWMVLALQTVVVAAAARNAKVLAMEITVWAVAIVSLVFYTDALGSLSDESSFVWWMMVLYPAVITLAFAFLREAYGKGFQYSKDFSRDWAYAIPAVTAIALWNELFEGTLQRGFDVALPFILIVYVAAGLSFVPIFRRWILLELAALAFVVGVAHYCDEPFSVLQLGGIVIAAGTALYFMVRDDSKLAIIAESLTYLLAIIPVSLWVLQVMDDWGGQQLVILVLCCMIVLGGLVPRVRQLGSWAFVPLLVYMLTESAIPGSRLWVLSAYFAGLGWFLIPVLVPAVKTGFGWASKSDIWSLIGAVLFWLCVIFFGDPISTWMSGQWVMGVMALLFLLGAHRFKIHGFLLCALLFAATGAGRQFITLLGGTNETLWKSEVLLSAGLLYAFAVLWFFLKPVPVPAGKERLGKLLLSVSSAGSAILLFTVSVVTFQYDELGWIDWYTPILAITAFAMILMGLFQRDLIFRRLGLVALLLPLGRLFIIDVQDALHRIIAFAASAFLLALLGYLYTRLAAKLVQEELEQSPDEGD